MRERCFPVPVLAILSLGDFQHTPVELLVCKIDKKVVSMGRPMQVSPSTSQPEEGNTPDLFGYVEAITQKHDAHWDGYTRLLKIG